MKAKVLPPPTGERLTLPIKLNSPGGCKVASFADRVDSSKKGQYPGTEDLEPPADQGGAASTDPGSKKINNNKNMKQPATSTHLPPSSKL